LTISHAGNATGYEYDALNRLTKELSADGTSKTFVLDKFGNATTTTDANGSVITNTYDDLNRLISRSISLATGVGGATSEAYEYDGLSRLTYAYDGDSTVKRRFDSMSNVRLDYQQIPGYGVSVEATYDGNGNMLTCMYPEGRVVKTDYDALNRKSRIFEGSSPEVDIVTYSYRGPYLVDKRAYPMSSSSQTVETEYAYDGIRRLTAIDHRRDPSGTPVTLEDLDFTWDRMSNKAARTRLFNGSSQTHNYEYDSIYRMTQSDIDSSSVRTYNLDGVGNRTSTTGTGGGSYFMASGDPPEDSQVNQYTRTHMSHREYDENGNLIEIAIMGDDDGDGDIDLTDYGAFQLCQSGQGNPAAPECNVFDYDDDGDVDLVDFGQFQLLFGTQPAARIKYDYRNQMISYEEFEDGSVATTHLYAYDALGRRIAKVIDDGGAGEVETRYIYSGWRVIEERDFATTVLATYVYGNYIDEVVQMRRDVDGTGGPEDYYYLTDDMFNVMALVDDTGAVVECYEYSDYGSPTYMDASWTTLGAAASDYDNPYLFTGRRYDNETAWYNYRTRYYDPFTGKCTIRDTIGTWGDPRTLGNAYSYVANNPFSLLDAYGFQGAQPPPAQPPAVQPPAPTTQWGSGSSSQGNCYRYACNDPIKPGESHSEFPGPGRPNDPKKYGCAELIKGAKADGMVDVDKKTDCCPPDHREVHLVVESKPTGRRPFLDYHWYREDGPGKWTHKPGPGAVVNVDASGNVVTDPGKADRDYTGKGRPNYDIDCGKLCAPKNMDVDANP
jgi:RHS repeat-associated protein